MLRDEVIQPLSRFRRCGRCTERRWMWRYYLQRALDLQNLRHALRFKIVARMNRKGNDLSGRDALREFRDKTPITVLVKEVLEIPFVLLWGLFERHAGAPRLYRPCRDLHRGRRNAVSYEFRADALRVTGGTE